MPLHITSIEFNWEVGGSGRVLESVEFPTGTVILPWPGNDADGYAKFEGPVYGPWTISAGATELIMTFSKSAMKVTGMKLLFSEAGCHLP